MGPRKELVALFAMLIFLSKNSFSKNILRYVQENYLSRVEKILKRNNSLVNKFFTIKVNGDDLMVTLLLVATQNRYVEMVKLLLDYGADPNLFTECSYCPSQSYTLPLSYAVMEYASFNRRDNSLKVCGEIIDLLLEHGADTNVINKCGRAPLSFSVCIPCLKISDKLLQYGADPFLKKYKGRNRIPFVLGIDREASGVIELLKFYQGQDDFLEDLMARHKSWEQLSYDEIEKFIMLEESSLFVKLKALTFLLKNREVWNIRDEEIKNYFRQIPFAYLFFSNDILFGFALENRYLQLVDSRGQTIEESMERCVIPEIIPTIFSRSRVLYEGNDLEVLFESKQRRKKRGFFFAMMSFFRKSKGCELIEGFDKQVNGVRDSLLVERTLMRMVKKAKDAGRIDFVNTFYKARGDCKGLSFSKLPPEVIGHIIGYTQCHDYFSREFSS